MSEIIIIGTGLAGLAAAVRLGEAGHRVRVLEMRPFPGGRATSFPLDNETIDNCQHILMRCCTSLLDFYQRMGVVHKIKFYNEFPLIEPGGRMSVLKGGLLPAPFHFTGSFLRLKFLSLADKIAVGRAMSAIYRENGRRTDLDDITMLDWLREKRQTEQAIARFWRPVLVSAINEELDRMAAAHGFQVFALGFLEGAHNYEMGVPTVHLAELFGERCWKRLPNVTFEYRAAVDQIIVENGRVAGVMVKGERLTADTYISAVPFERLEKLFPELGIDYTPFEHSSITGIHLWFDRKVTDLANAAMLDRTIQWMYNKDGGRYLQIVVSASKNLLTMGRQEIIDLALKELAEFFPLVKQARLEKAQVVKEAHATFSPLPGLESKRPEAKSKFPNFFLAGDWTKCGWPATMEGAVRSGYKAADAVLAVRGN